MKEAQYCKNKFCVIQSRHNITYTAETIKENFIKFQVFDISFKARIFLCTRQTVLLNRTFHYSWLPYRVQNNCIIYCNMVHIYREIIFYTIRSFVLSNRVCEAGLHLRTDLFLEVLNSGGRVGRSSYPAGPIQNPNFNARETLFREKNIIKPYKIKFIWGLRFRPVFILRTGLLPWCLWSEFIFMCDRIYGPILNTRFRFGGFNLY